MYQVYAVDMTELNNDILNTFILKVSSEKYLEIHSYHNRIDSYRKLLADIMVRYIYCRITNTNNLSAVAFNKNYFGKPYILGDISFEYNISHSGKWVVCAFSKKAVGIDVEKIGTINLAMTKRFLSNEEINIINKIKEPKNIELMTELWVLKESYIKAVGKGLFIPLTSFSISFKHRKIIHQNGYSPNVKLKLLYLDDKYKLAICSFGQDFEQPIRIIKVEEILIFIKDAECRLKSK